MGKKALVSERRPRRAVRTGVPNSQGKRYRPRKEREITSEAIRDKRKSLLKKAQENPETVKIRPTGRMQTVPTAIDFANHVNAKMKMNFSDSTFRVGLGPRRDVVRKVREANQRASSRQRLREMQREAGVGVGSWS